MRAEMTEDCPPVKIAMKMSQQLAPCLPLNLESPHPRLVSCGESAEGAAEGIPVGAGEEALMEPIVGGSLHGWGR